MALVGVLDNKSGGQQVFRATAAVDLPSTLTQVSGTVSVTITGLLPGDIVFVVPNTALTTGSSLDTGCVMVTTADTVVVRFTNSSASTYDPASQVMNFMVFRNNVPE